MLIGNPKTFKLLILLFLAMGIFTSCLITEICFCGEACSHSLLNKIKDTKSLPFHGHCAGTNCKSCNFEDGQVLKAKTASTRSSDVKSFCALIFLFSLSAYILNNHPINGITSFLYAGGKIQFTPIYLQKQSFLC